MMDDIHIRPTKAQDLAALRRIAGDTDLFPPEMLDGLLSPWLDGTEEALWLTCQYRGAPVGFGYAVPEPLTDGTWNLRALAVSPAHQGQSLGTRLLRGVEDALSQRHQRLLIVDTSGSEDFAQTRRFYDKNGYEAAARIRDFWADGDDKVTYRMDLRRG